jgi:glycosyltransferase involved in cell wall biosynthesis
LAGNALKILLLADDCNPEWPSLPIVGYKYALALSKLADVTVVTQIRNKENIQKANPSGIEFRFLDTEYLSKHTYRLASWLRGGNQVAWSINMIFNYPMYLEFERQVIKKFGKEIRQKRFDIIHRITPMSPTIPSMIAGKFDVPFVIGPLNGNLPWPKEFAKEQARERERARILRNFYKLLPYASSTYKKANLILAAFKHTIDDIDKKHHFKTVMFPEIGFDETIFYPPNTPRVQERLVRFLFAGRLVPYKLPEVAVRAFGESEILRSKAVLRVVGSGPELERLQAIVANNGLKDCVSLENGVSQSELATIMRASDVFVFPSIRELGAGVVIEAMACGLPCIAVDYGAPGDLVDESRGLKVQLAPLENLAVDFCKAMEHFVTHRDQISTLASAAVEYAFKDYTWHAKASRTVKHYQRLRLFSKS